MMKEGLFKVTLKFTGLKCETARDLAAKAGYCELWEVSENAEFMAFTGAEFVAAPVKSNDPIRSIVRIYSCQLKTPYLAIEDVPRLKELMSLLYRNGAIIIKPSDCLRVAFNKKVSKKYARMVVHAITSENNLLYTLLLYEPLRARFWSLYCCKNVDAVRELNRAARMCKADQDLIISAMRVSNVSIVDEIDFGGLIVAACRGGHVY